MHVNKPAFLRRTLLYTLEPELGIHAVADSDLLEAFLERRPVLVPERRGPISRHIRAS
jgi:hypothetical protein